MSWLAWALVVGVAAVVGAAVLGAALRARLDGSQVGLAIVTTVYVTGLVVGVFLTAMSSPTPATWWHALAGRVAWQVGGSALMAAAVFALAQQGGTTKKPAVWLVAAVLVGVGLLVAANPLRDLVEGPVTMPALGLSTHTWERVRGGGAIEGTLTMRAPDGTEQALDLSGWSVTDAQGRLDGCSGATEVHVTVLRHVAKVVDVRCR